jgi:hypothetical protein
MEERDLATVELNIIANYLRWTEVGLDVFFIIVISYILYLVYTTKMINTIEWQFTKLGLILDMVFCTSSFIYYPIYIKYPNSTWLCQIGGLIKPSLFAICLVCVLELMTIRFMRYVLKISVKDWVWYGILGFLICLDLALMLYFSVLEKLRPTILGYCFIDPLMDQASRFAMLFVLILAGISALIIIVNYTLLCRLGLRMGSYISSEDFSIDKNSIIEKSMLIVMTKSLSIILTYTITIFPKIISVTNLVIYQKSISPKFDLIADFLLSMNTVPNLLTTILLNSIIRKRLINPN